MTSHPDPTPPEAQAPDAGKTTKSFPARTALQVAAAVFGLYLVGSGVYGLWKGGNPQDKQANAPTGETGACTLNKPVMTALKAQAQGEVAGFSINDEPRKLGNFSFKAADGTDRRFSDFSGKVILVNLWATWCTPCRKEMPAFDALQKARGTKSFEVVAINVDTRNPERVPEFLDGIGVKTLARYSDPSGMLLQDMKKAGPCPWATQHCTA
jgi:thiol-disulfide isomerase/thioredoxin